MFRPVATRVLASALFLCPAGGFPGITAAVAANVQFAMEELKAGFKGSTGIGVRTVYGASGTLAAQIRNGAPFDVFVSADMEFPDSVHAWGYAPEKPKPYARGKLVVWTLRDLDLDPGLSALADPGVARIALPDPRRAPYGRAALQALERSGLRERVRSRLVYGESVSQVVQYLLTGNADVVFSAEAAARSVDGRGKGTWKEVDGALYDALLQGAVICRHGAENHPRDSARFLAFLYSPYARAILSNHGYALP